MTTIHLIETEEERALVKRIFRQRVLDAADAAMDMSADNIEGDMTYNDAGSRDLVPSDGALVYDILDGGDPELGWMVYDFRETTCYWVCEEDTAGLMNELPSRVFPF